jgi:hypothetical protein
MPRWSRVGVGGGPAGPPAATSSNDNWEATEPAPVVTSPLWRPTSDPAPFSPPPLLIVCLHLHVCPHVHAHIASSCTQADMGMDRNVSNSVISALFFSVAFAFD